MRTLICLLACLPLTAAWNYTVLSEATESSFVSRLVLVNGAPQERTFVAYRDASGSLSVARLIGSSFTSVVVSPGVSPSNTFASLSPNGTLLVTFWNNNQFRFALAAGTGAGNCGPSLEYRCGTIPLPAGHTSTAIERVVGEVASNGTAHFVYALRSSAPATGGQALYSVSRSLNGVWTTPVRMQHITDPSMSPTSFSYGPDPAGTLDGHVSGFSPLTVQYVLVSAQQNWPLNLKPFAVFLGSERRAFSRAHCINYAPTGQPRGIRVQRRNTNAQIYADTPLFTPSATLSSRNWCDIAVNSADTAAVVAFSTTAGVVTLGRSPARGAWDASAWTLETIDATSAFGQPQVAYRLSGKLFVAYQGSNFVKLAIEQ